MQRVRQGRTGFRRNGRGAPQTGGNKAHQFLEDDLNEFGLRRRATSPKMGGQGKQHAHGKQLLGGVQQPPGRFAAVVGPRRWFSIHIQFIHTYESIVNRLLAPLTPPPPWFDPRMRDGTLQFLHLPFCVIRCLRQDSGPAVRGWWRLRSQAGRCRWRVCGNGGFAWRLAGRRPGRGGNTPPCSCASE